MKLHNLNTKQTFKSRNLCLCIGNFDGIHLGHQHVIKKIINNSRSDNLKSAIMTFVPHPKIYFKKTDGNLAVMTGKVRQFRAGSPLVSCARPVLPRRPLEHNLDVFRAAPGRSSDASRTLLGCLPDAPRTPPGRSSDASRATPNRSVVFSDSVAFSNYVWLGRQAGESTKTFINT